MLQTHTINSLSLFPFVWCLAAFSINLTHYQMELGIWIMFLVMFTADSVLVSVSFISNSRFFIPVEIIENGTFSYLHLGNQKLTIPDNEFITSSPYWLLFKFHLLMTALWYRYPFFSFWMYLMTIVLVLKTQGFLTLFNSPP